MVAFSPTPLDVARRTRADALVRLVPLARQPELVDLERGEGVMRHHERDAERTRRARVRTARPGRRRQRGSRIWTGK